MYCRYHSFLCASNWRQVQLCCWERACRRFDGFWCSNLQDTAVQVCWPSVQAPHPRTKVSSDKHWKRNSESYNWDGTINDITGEYGLDREQVRWNKAELADDCSAQEITRTTLTEVSFSCPKHTANCSFPEPDYSSTRYFFLFLNF